MSLIVHKGGQIATRNDLVLIEVPEATDTYVPVPHDHLADTLSTIGLVAPDYWLSYNLRMSKI